MLRRWWKSITGMSRKAEGSAALEFSLVLPAFLLIMGGILDFGHAWYIQQVITNASREGARYGINYTTNTNGTRIAASSKSPTVDTVVRNRLADLLPVDTVEVQCGGTGFTSTNPSGLPLEVTVRAVKRWWMLSCFLGEEQKTIEVTTTMSCE